MIDMIWLVVDLPLWKMMEFVSWDDFFPFFPNTWKNKTCSKPPTSDRMYDVIPEIGQDNFSKIMLGP